MRELILKLGILLSLVRTDGLLHIAVSALLLVALGWIRPLWVPCVIVAAVGIAKELYDRFSGEGTAEWHDLVCDAIGIVIGCICVWLNMLGR